MENFYRLIQGDSLKVLPTLKDESIDLVVTDPPYGINYFSNYYKNMNPHKSILNDNVLFLPTDNLWKLIKSTGSLFVFFSHKKILQDKRLKNIIIWVKNNWSAGDLFGDFGNQYEMIGFLPKEKFKLKSKRYTNVWNFKRVRPELHPTQKPEDLIARIIESSTVKGDVVLDPFMGSGTTMKVCQDLERSCIGIEQEIDYCDIIKNRCFGRTFLDHEVKYSFEVFP